MCARRWYRGETPKYKQKKNYLFLKRLKCTQKVLKENLCFQPSLVRGFTFFKN